MRLALLADVHGNLEALQACLEHATLRGVQRFAFLGDFLGYGADPVAVLDLVEEEARAGAVVILGNHEAALLHPSSIGMNESAGAAIAWQRSRLQERHLTFLASLPLFRREGEMAFVHASAAAPEKWIYVGDPLRAANSIEAAGVPYLFSGHVHEPLLYYIGASGRPLPFNPVPGAPIPLGPHRRWLAITGSVGQPRDGDPSACYALFDQEQASLTYFRVPYDHHLAAAKIRAAGLPERLADRLERGE